MFSLQLAQHAKGVKMALNEKFTLKSQFRIRFWKPKDVVKKIPEENNKDSFND